MKKRVFYCAVALALAGAFGACNNDDDKDKKQYERVDLGLPSGVKWATMNIGAERPEDYGTYFAWGETKPRTAYNWVTYLDEAVADSTDCKTEKAPLGGRISIAGTQYDAATKNWGGKWRMPTADEIRELVENTTGEWVTQNGVNGRKFTAENGNSIFLPAAGYRTDADLDGNGSHGVYWSASLFEDNTCGAFYLLFGSEKADWDYGTYRYYGMPVRAVCE